MAGVAFCLSQQDFPGEQAFPPQGNQADGIQIGRMKGPKSHGFLDCERSHNVDSPCAAHERLQRRVWISGCSVRKPPFQFKRFFQNSLVAGNGY